MLAHSDSFDFPTKPAPFKDDDNFKKKDIKKCPKNRELSLIHSYE